VTLLKTITWLHLGSVNASHIAVIAKDMSDLLMSQTQSRVARLWL